MPSESYQDPRSQRDTQYSTADESATPERIPEYIEPAPDRYGGVNFPYRGQQTHGVEPTDTAAGSPENYEGGTVEVAYPPAPGDIIPPVPVRIVETDTEHEYTQWRTVQAFASGAPTMVLSRKEGRERVTVKNISITGTDTHVWIGPDSNVSKMSGFRVESDGGSVTLERCEAEIWAVSDDPTKTLPLCILFEFSTAVR
jgi:hypothetical protein